MLSREFCLLRQYNSLLGPKNSLLPLQGILLERRQFRFLTTLASEVQAALCFPWDQAKEADHAVE
jgi:hypothetical protein